MGMLWHWAPLVVLRTGCVEVPMKITQTQLIAIAHSMLSAGNRIGSVTLTVDRLRSAVESGHPATGGVKYDTPKQGALEAAVASVVTAYAGKLTVDGSVVRVLSDNLRTAKAKDDTIRVIRNQKADCGQAVEAVAWLHNLRAYIASITRDGAKAVSRKIRAGLVTAFNALKPADLAVLNVGSDKTAGTGGLGLAKARKIVANMAAAESEALATFVERQTALGIAQGETVALDAKRAAGRKPARKPARRGAYGVRVRKSGEVKITRSGSPAADGSTLHSQALTAASANGAPLTV
ncbi:MAG TPA: hypothetical protein VNU68_21310 [Verrucomicrobiae bacterium]|nr:hypothetical protein [Verrucomicrobiae bacterium]